MWMEPRMIFMSLQFLSNVQNIPCINSIGVPVTPSAILGEAGCARGPIPGYVPSVCSGCGHYANSFMLTFMLQDTPDIAPRAKVWEKDVFMKLSEQFSAAGLRTSYMAQRSVQDQIIVVGSQNAWVVAVSYLAMFCYIVLALGKFPHPVATRVSLSLQVELVTRYAV
jgi:hypothetical protein